MVSFEDILTFLDSCNISYRVYTPFVVDLKKIMLTDAFCHSRNVLPGSVFCCVSGGSSDGHDFALSACQRGCEAILCERELDEPDVPQIIVDSVRKTMGYVSSFIYGVPSEKLVMVAVTGTNGKSTSTYMIRSLLQESGIKTGMLGTIVYDDGNGELPAERTTPESCDIQRFLARMVDNGCGACVMEASSHGLVQGRMNGCLFDVGVFTNITPEHLDYHGNIEEYFQAKRLLYTRYMKQDWKGSVNVDDESGKRLFAEFPDRFNAYGLGDAGKNVFTVENLKMSLKGLMFDLRIPGEDVIHDLKLPLTGRYNAYNVLAAIASVSPLGISADIIRNALENMPQVPGRLEKYLFANGVCCVIDYAHTPDALQNVLKALREVSAGHLSVVFGLGGNRFRENRPRMGKIAAEMADRITVTMDNPRNEDPDDIADQIVAGIVSVDAPQVTYKVIIDREEAVQYALNSAAPSDIVLVAGKGPEKYIIWGEDRIPYNDSETVKAWADSHQLEWQ